MVVMGNGGDGGGGGSDDDGKGEKSIANINQEGFSGVGG